MGVSLEALKAASGFAGAERRFRTADADAVEAQAQIKREMSRANTAILVAGVCGGLLLAAGILAEALAARGSWAWVASVPVLLGVAGGTAGALGSMWLFRARQGERLRRWMARRAVAETARRAMYMELVTSTAPADADPTEVALAKLDCVLTEHVQDQRAWFDKRAREHRQSADRSLALGSTAVALSAAASLAAGAAAAASPSYAAIGALGVIGAALATFATTREEIHQDRRNAERYENARDALDLLLDKVGDVRQAIRNGATDALPAFVSAVHEQLLAEHREWLQGEERRVAVIGQLEDTLAKLNKEQRMPKEP
jgi:hypothetical protein